MALNIFYISYLILLVRINLWSVWYLRHTISWTEQNSHSVAVMVLHHGHFFPGLPGSRQKFATSARLPSGKSVATQRCLFGCWASQRWHGLPVTVTLAFPWYVWLLSGLAKHHGPTESNIQSRTMVWKTHLHSYYTDSTSYSVMAINFSHGHVNQSGQMSSTCLWLYLPIHWFSASRGIHYYMMNYISQYVPRIHSLYSSKCNKPKGDFFSNVIWFNILSTHFI